jgi:hypothetical protein
MHETMKDPKVKNVPTPMTLLTHAQTNQGEKRDKRSTEAMVRTFIIGQVNFVDRVRAFTISGLITNISAPVGRGLMNEQEVAGRPSTDATSAIHRICRT